MPTEENLILDKAQITQKIKRIAYEIYENNFQEKELVVAGIYDKGYILAQLLKSELEEIAPAKVLLVKVMLDKQAPLQSEVSLDCPLSDLQNKTVIITDDVLNTGRTLAFSLKPFLNTGIKKLQTAVLVNRGHKLFPVSADYTGYELSTTIQEHIEVVWEAGRAGVYLH